MSSEVLISRTFDVFRADVTTPPPLTLRGGNAVDGYARPTAYDSAVDEPTDAYLEGFAFWGLGYLDAQSWRHYLPRLIDYAFRHPDDPAMVTEALIRSLRPPDRYPPRLTTLSAEQEETVKAFLEQVVLGGVIPHLQAEAQYALEEWWLPNARSRPTSHDVEILRAAPVIHRRVDGDVYMLSIPDTFSDSGVRDIPEESRRVQTWGGYLCGDGHTVVAVNVTPLAKRSLADAVGVYTSLFRDPVSSRPTEVPGASHSTRLDGLTHGDSPAEPQTLVVLLAVTGSQLVALSVRSWPREDLGREVERIVDSFALVRR